MPKKSKGNKVKKAQPKPDILKRKKTKVGKAKRKMKTKGRIVSGKGSKKKLLAYGSNSSSNSNNSETISERESDRERKALISALQRHTKLYEKDPKHLWNMRHKDVFNFNS